VLIQRLGPEARIITRRRDFRRWAGVSERQPFAARRIMQKMTARERTTTRRLNRQWRHGAVAVFVMLAGMSAPAFSTVASLRAPCTTYKPADIARARRNIARHPWAERAWKRLKARAALYTDMDRDRIRAFIPAQTPLIVDIFRVHGKQKNFTWTLHARSADWRVKGVADLRSAGVPKPLRDGRRGRAAGDVQAVWRFPGETPRGLALWLPAMDGAATVILAACPAEEDAIQACHVGGGALKPGAVIPYRGHLRVVRPGPDATFVAVYAPFKDNRVPGVRVELQRLPGCEGALALRLRRGRGSFVVLYTPKAGKIRFEDTELNGRACVATLRDGKLNALCLAAGTYARHGKATLVRDTIGNAYAGKDSATRENMEFRKTGF
jgi:hypothetical protein